MSPPLVSLCLIAKDEEAMIGPCLASAAPLCEQLVVVDTGSRDATMDIAREHGAEVYQRPWDDDFAAARNAAIDHAQGTWVLILDADERLGPGSAERIRRVLETAGHSFDCGLLRLHDAKRLDSAPGQVISGAESIAEPMYIARLLRRTDDLRYEGVIHESVRDWVVRHGNRQRDCEGDIVHYGAVPDHRVARSKSERNIGLLRKRLAAEPDDFTVHGYLAHELLSLDEREEAWACIEEGWKLFRKSEPTALRSVLRLTAARALIQFQRSDAKGALETANEAEAYEGRSPDTSFFRGRAHEMLAQQTDEEAREGEHLAEAAAAYEDCIAQHDRLVAQRYVRGATSWSGKTRLGTVRLLQTELEEARRLFDEAAATSPDPTEAQLGAAEAVLEHGDARLALSLLENLRHDEQPDACLLSAAAHEELGELDPFEVLLGRAREHVGDGYLAPHRNRRHGELHVSLLTYRGHPTPGKGAIGTTAALMAGKDGPPTTIGPRDQRPLRTLVRNLLLLDRPNLVEPLLAPSAEDRLPGIRNLVRDVVTSLGMSIEES